jgi:hypothetical protein
MQCVALACCEMNGLFVDVVVTLYFLQQSRPDSIKRSDIIVTVARPSESHVLTDLASLIYSAFIL